MLKSAQMYLWNLTSKTIDRSGTQKHVAFSRFFSRLCLSFESGSVTILFEIIISSSFLSAAVYYTLPTPFEVPLLQVLCH